MQLNQSNKDNYIDISDTNEKIFPSEKVENLNYLYPNGHRITHQMRWFKAIRKRGLVSKSL